MVGCLNCQGDFAERDTLGRRVVEDSGGSIWSATPGVVDILYFTGTAPHLRRVYLGDQWILVNGLLDDWTLTVQFVRGTWRMDIAEVLNCLVKL